MNGIVKHPLATDGKDSGLLRGEAALERICIEERY